MQASLKEHRVIESKPDNTVEDLRFHQPWPQLKHFADAIDLASADDITHKHVPYGGSLLITWQELASWEHTGFQAWYARSVAMSVHCLVASVCVLMCVP